MSKKEKSEKELLKEMDEKLKIIIFLLSRQAKLSKREIDRITGIDRHKF